MDNPETYKMAFQALVNLTDPLANVMSRDVLGILFDMTEWNDFDSLKHITLKHKNLYQEPKISGFTKTQIDQHCLDFFKQGAAKLSIEFIDSEVMQIKMDTRFTFMDQLGIVGNELKYHQFLIDHQYFGGISGGTIGLFTGFSIISLIEIAYWLFKAAEHIIIGRNNIQIK